MAIVEAGWSRTGYTTVSYSPQRFMLPTITSYLCQSSTITGLDKLIQIKKKHTPKTGLLTLLAAGTGLA